MDSQRGTAPAVTVIGGGLAGCEAAYQVAARGLPVVVREMRPGRMTEAHATAELAELVCSNSLRSNEAGSAPGLLKEELRRLGSLIISVADGTAVPAGKALAVDRKEFSRRISALIESHPSIRVVREEARELPGGIVVVATGPLTSPALADALGKVIGDRYLYFYDAISPIVSDESLDRERLFAASRYGGYPAYLNAPMDEEEYRAFREALLDAEPVPLREFEDLEEAARDVGFFEGCLPVEEIAGRGEETLRFGPMKPVGLTDPKTGKRPYAVVQLRSEDRAGTMYNLVGFQTRLRRPDQRRIFRMIPGLEKAEFLRYGSVHRNTYIDGPRCLRETLEMRAREGTFVAGQLCGVEGYVESVASGLVAGINAVRLARGQPLAVLPSATMSGALLRYVTSEAPWRHQPINANFGVLAPVEGKVSGRARRQAKSDRALAALEEWMGEEENEHDGTDDRALRRYSRS